jgi:hypothetical protein
MNISHFPPQISQWIESRKYDILQRNSNRLLALSRVLAFIRASTDTCELSSAPVFYYTGGIRTPEKEEKERSLLSAVKITQRNEATKYEIPPRNFTFWRSRVCPCAGPGFTRLERENYERSVLSPVGKPMERGHKR